MGIEHSIQKVTTCSSTPVCKSPSKDPRNSKGGPTDRATIILNDKTQLGPNISAKRRSRKSNNKQATPTKPPKVSKTVFIESEDGTKLKIPIDTSQENFTCEWLTNQAREVLSQNNLLKLESSHPLVTLQTADGNITIDYWLSCPTRSISILKDGMVLKPFYGDNRYQIGENKVNLKYFHFVKLLGSGGFSKVYLIRRKDNGKLLALKAICKEELTDQDKRQAIVNERDVFVRLHHPFLTKLHFAFQTVTHLFFVMDFFPGGDLFYHLSTRKKFTEDQVKVYVGEIILALNYLHKNNIIYRDIKPENILVDIDGHLHLSDFGLCKPLNNKLDLNFTFCGSPEYLAPEMIQNVGYSFPVDHYGLGILVYELVVGRPPFHTRKHGDLMDQIVSKKVQFPSGMSANLQSFLSMLLNKNAKKRLGAKGGFTEIIAHPWCQGIDLAKIAKKKVKPPIVPNLHQMNFDKGFLEKEITLEDDNSVMYAQDFQDYFRYDMDDGAMLGQLRRSKAQSEPYKNFSFYSNIDDPYDKYLDSMLASKQDDDDELDINAIKLVEKLNKSDGEIKPQNELICQAFKSEKSTNAFAGKFNLNIEQACLENYEEDPYEGPFSAKELASYTTQPIKPLKDTGSNPFASLVQTQTSIVFNEKPKGKHKATLSYDASLKDPRYLAPSTAVSSLQWISTGPNSNQSLPKSTTNLKKEINADKSQDSLMLDEFEIEAVHSCNSVRELPKIRGLKKPHTQVIQEGVNVK